MKKIIIYATIMFLVACANNGNKPESAPTQAANTEDSLLQQVMNGHDAAMAKFGKLRGYRQQVSERIDSLKKVKSNDKAARTEELKQLGVRLSDAEEHMNEWMNKFNFDSAQDDAKKRVQYLTDEKVRVDRVKTEVLSAVAAADSVFKK